MIYNSVGIFYKLNMSMMDQRNKFFQSGVTVRINLKKKAIS